MDYESLYYESLYFVSMHWHSVCVVCIVILYVGCRHCVCVTSMRCHSICMVSHSSFCMHAVTMHWHSVCVVCLCCHSICVVSLCIDTLYMCCVPVLSFHMCGVSMHWHSVCVWYLQWHLVASYVWRICVDTLCVLSLSLKWSQLLSAWLFQQASGLLPVKIKCGVGI